MIKNNLAKLLLNEDWNFLFTIHFNSLCKGLVGLLAHLWLHAHIQIQTHLSGKGGTRTSPLPIPPLKQTNVKTGTFSSEFISTHCARVWWACARICGCLHTCQFRSCAKNKNCGSQKAIQSPLIG